MKLKRNFSNPGKSKCAAQILIALRKCASLRLFVVDRHLNTTTVRDEYRIAEIIESIVRNMVFSTLTNNSWYSKRFLKYSERHKALLSCSIDNSNSSGCYLASNRAHIVPTFHQNHFFFSLIHIR